MTKNFPIMHNGNESLFLAIEMSLIAGAAGIPFHIHAEGLRGTGKTTIMQCVKDNMPKIERIKGCLYQCDKESPHCPNHKNTEKGQFLTEEIPAPFLEIGHGAKLGTILGSVDLEKLTDPSNPEAALMPGSIPMAHRGILFIDEINRLAETAPEITDVLLSVMGTKPGRIKIEEVGLSPWELEIKSSVWATSNPDEDPGPLEEIRRQLSDRFDLVIPVHRPSEPSVVELMLKKKAMVPHAPFPNDFENKVARFKKVVLPPDILGYMANLYVRRNIESIRAIEALDLSSRLFAAIEGSYTVTLDHVAKVLPLVLRHRVEPIVLSQILGELEEQKQVAGTKQTDPLEDQEPKKAEEKTEPKADVEDNKVQPQEQKAAANEQKDEKPNDKKPWYHKFLEKLSTATPASGGRQRQGAQGKGQGKGQSGTDNRSGSKTGGQKSGGQEGKPGSGNSKANGKGNTKTKPVLQDPKTTPPLSPPERARHIDSLSWVEMISAPKWRDE